MRLMLPQTEVRDARVHIEFLEIAKFRKLLSTRVDLSSTTTLFVGANNSGKTSAMLALRRFLSPRRCPFEMHDFTLCHWPSYLNSQSLFPMLNRMY